MSSLAPVYQVLKWGTAMMSSAYAYNGPHENLRGVLTDADYALMKATFREMTYKSKQFPTRGPNSPWSLMTCKLVGTNAADVAAKRGDK